jgi:GT2 family glycosyltransferase
MTSLLAAADTPQPVEAVSGACLMTHRLIFQQVGGFSEDYFMYYEDMDYCFKVSNAGRKNYFVPDAAVIHHGGKSSGSEAFSPFSVTTMAESAWRFFRKQRGFRYAQLFRICLAAKAISRLCLLIPAHMVTSSGALNLRARAALRKWTYVLHWCLEIVSSQAANPGARY